MGITQAQITEALQAFLPPGGPLLVHSSLSSFGHVTGSAPAVLTALLDVVTPNGSLFAPTFNFGQLPFDPATTPSLTGAISEVLRRHPHALRSSHPTHPLSGIGPDAPRILAEHPLMHPFGKNSPLYHLWEQNAHVLLLGCDHRSSSMIHVAEEIAGVPYLKRTRIGRVIEAGEIKEITVTRPPCSKGFNVIDAVLRSRPEIQETHIGAARALLMSAADIVSAATTLLDRDPTALLCTHPQCEVCPQSREMIRSNEKY